MNEQFVAEIQRLQGNLPLSDSDIQDAIKLFKLSPSAVLWAIQPDQMIVTHRNDSSYKGDEITDRFDRNYFFRELFRSLRFDLTHPIARTYLLDVFKVREIETKQKILVKSNSSLIIESDLHERLGIGELADNLKGPDGSSNILMLLLENAPEPWDVSAWNNDVKNSSDEEQAVNEE